MTTPITQPDLIEVVECTCGEVCGEDPNCDLHGRDTVWALENPEPGAVDIVALIAEAIANADAGIGYSIRLVGLVDGVSTYTLTYQDEPEVLEFPSHADATDHVVARRNLERAKAVLAALRARTPVKE